MGRLSGLVFVALAIVVLLDVSADNVIYSVTFPSCAQGSTCPQGNPLSYNRTFALNGTFSPNLTLNVGDRLQFNLATDVPNHPLTICRNSPIPNFCQGVNSTDILNTPIIQAGSNTSVNFTAAGTYYYGCFNHSGMGAMISVSQITTTTTMASTTRSSGNKHQFSAPLLFIAAAPLFTMILI